MTTVEKLNYLISIKSDIKTAIENKGVDMTGVSFLGYAGKIGEIVSGVGYIDRDVIEGRYQYNISNSASFVYSSVFEYKAVQTVDLPNCLYVGSNGFYNCVSLTTVNIPVCTSLYNNAFRNCTNLTTVNLPSCTDLHSNAFRSCYNLNTIYIGTGLSTVATMASSNALLDCSALQSIYVPASLVDAYKSAENWSYYSSIIYPFGGPEPTEYYIKWTPSSASGTMWIRSTSVEGPVSYQISSYSGMLNFGNIYPQYLSFESCTWSNIKTNIPMFNESLAFARCSTLQNADLYSCTSLFSYTFEHCSSLSQVSLPICEYIGDAVFNNCESLSQVSLPMCSYIGDYAFFACSSLSQVSLPVCSYIGIGVFELCSSLSQISLPMCSYIGSYAFWSCKSLSQISLPKCSYIGIYAFEGCRSLSIITLGYSSVCSLGGIGAFNNTQITSSTGDIYVPASLVSVYKSANGWLQYSAIIQSYPGL